MSRLRREFHRRTFAVISIVVLVVLLGVWFVSRQVDQVRAQDGRSSRPAPSVLLDGHPTA